MAAAAAAELLSLAGVGDAVDEEPPLVPFALLLSNAARVSRVAAAARVSLTGSLTGISNVSGARLQQSATVDTSDELMIVVNAVAFVVVITESVFEIASLDEEEAITIEGKVSLSVLLLLRTLALLLLLMIVKLAVEVLFSAALRGALRRVGVLGRLVVVEVRMSALLFVTVVAMIDASVRLLRSALVKLKLDVTRELEVLTLLVILAVVSSEAVATSTTVTR